MRIKLLVGSATMGAKVNCLWGHQKWGKCKVNFWWGHQQWGKIGEKVDCWWGHQQWEKFGLAIQLIPRLCLYKK